MSRFVVAQYTTSHKAPQAVKYTKTNFEISQL